jgi:hypothetical protein
VLLGRGSGLDVRTKPSEPRGPRLLFHGERAKEVPESGLFEIVLTSPDGGTVARVAARFDREFEGGVWVTEALARALDLHQFEIPGRASAVSPEPGAPNTVGEVVGHRARVRVEVASVGYERTLEAFVPTDGPTALGAASTHTFEFRGVEGGTAYAATDGLTLGPDLSVVMDGHGETRGFGARHFLFTGQDGAHVAVAEEPDGSPRRLLLLGSFDPWRPETIRLERLTLPGPFPAGAHATLAAVWRGKTAVPAEEGVGVTTVAADGSLTFLRRAGAQGERPRVRLVTPEGKAIWHDVHGERMVAAGEGASLAVGVDARVRRGDAPLFLHVRVASDGRVSLRSTPDGAAPAWREHGSWSLDIAEPQAARQALRDLHRALRDVLGSREERPALWSADAHSRALLLVDGEESALWRYVQWVLATAASPQTRVWRLSFALPGSGEWVDHELPKDRGQQGSPVDVKPFKDIEVKLFRDNLDKPLSEQYTKIRVGETFTVLLPKGPWPKEGDRVAARRREEARVMDQVAAAIKQAWAQQDNNPDIAGEIKTPFPKGLAVPHGDVMSVLGAFAAAGIQQVHFEGAPPPPKLREKDGGQLGEDDGGWGFEEK